jgi:hypothetical protein
MDTPPAPQRRIVRIATPVLESSADRERLRRQFRPPQVRLLFIGESAPASGRFFYSRDSGLYRAIRDAFRGIDPSIDDRNFLTAFQASGCYLIDLCQEPVDRLDPQSRGAARAAGEHSLSVEIARTRPGAIAPLLRSIAANVSRAVSHSNWQGELIPLPYPGRWHRHRTAFIAALSPALHKLLLRRSTA